MNKYYLKFIIRQIFLYETNIYKANALIELDVIFTYISHLTSRIKYIIVLIKFDLLMEQRIFREQSFSRHAMSY